MIPREGHPLIYKSRNVSKSPPPPLILPKQILNSTELDEEIEKYEQMLQQQNSLLAEIEQRLKIQQNKQSLLDQFVSTKQKKATASPIISPIEIKQRNIEAQELQGQRESRKNKNIQDQNGKRTRKDKDYFQSPIIQNLIKKTVDKDVESSDDDLFEEFQTIKQHFQSHIIQREYPENEKDSFDIDRLKIRINQERNGNKQQTRKHANKRSSKPIKVSLDHNIENSLNRQRQKSRKQTKSKTLAILNKMEKQTCKKKRNPSEIIQESIKRQKVKCNNLISRINQHIAEQHCWIQMHT